MDKCNNDFYHKGAYQMTDLPVYCNTCGERVNGDGEKSKFEARIDKLIQQK